MEAELLHHLGDVLLDAAHHEVEVVGLVAAIRVEAHHCAARQDRVHAVAPEGLAHDGGHVPERRALVEAANGFPVLRGRVR